MVSSKLWEGARRATELAAERRELLDRCSRAEAAAQSARDACARLSTKLAATLGVDGSNGGSLSARPSAVGTAVGRSHGTPASAGARPSHARAAARAPRSRQRGRATFEAHRRRESSSRWHSETDCGARPTARQRRYDSRTCDPTTGA